MSNFSDSLNFSQRFNGKTAYLKKEGIIGLLSQKSQPIDKSH